MERRSDLEGLFRPKAPKQVCSFEMDGVLYGKIEKVAKEIGHRQVSHVLRHLLELGWANFSKRRGIK